MFYKAFLELDGSNLVSILSFDSRSMEFLLQDQFSEYFSKEYPIFYKNKIQKGNWKDQRFFYRSAIDNALRNNQVKAVQIMCDYIVKYQNNFASAFLFSRTFPVLIEKGIEVTNLLNSDIFSYQFDYDEWPGTHTNENEYIRPYNRSIFDIHNYYKEVFPEEEFAEIFDSDGNTTSDIETNKIYKIKYELNVLPCIGTYVIDSNGRKELKNGDVNFMGAISQTDELDIFNTETLKMLIDFKWQEYGMRHHLVGSLMQFLQIIILCLYVDTIYIHNQLCSGHGDDITCEDNVYAFVLLGGVVYPLVYELIHCCKLGLTSYITSINHILDIIYIGCSIAMTFVHVIIPPIKIVPQIVMISVTLLSIIRCFKFMRIFTVFSPIVIMLHTVVIDLQAFMLFYTILIGLFSLLFGILGLGSMNANVNPLFAATFKGETEGYPGVEYR